MCILSIFLNVDSSIPFLCFHNRDEFVSRPVAPPNQNQAVLHGIDMKEGGTWMGTNPVNGIFVALTNVRRKNSGGVELSRSRGKLVHDLLQLDGFSLAEIEESSMEFLMNDNVLQVKDRKFLDLKHVYAPFNIIFATFHDHKPRAYYITNTPIIQETGSSVVEDGPLYNRAVVFRIPDGVHTMSNSGLNDFSWPKVRFLHDEMKSLQSNIFLESDIVSDFQEEKLLNIIRLGIPVMCGHKSVPIEEGYSPDVSWSPLPRALELTLQSNIFVPYQSDFDYGTRALTVVVLEGDMVSRRNVHYWYASFDPVDPNCLQTPSASSYRGPPVNDIEVEDLNDGVVVSQIRWLPFLKKLM